MLDDRFSPEQAEYFLDRLFEDRKGFVAMAYGHNPRLNKPRFAPGDMRSKYYSWPDEKDQLLEDVDNAVNSPETRPENVEVFICPSLRKSPSRKAGTNAPLRWVWADMDHPPSQDQIDRLNSLGAMTVLSGTEGHRHVYLPLEKPVSPEVHQALCRALKDTVGGDSKIAENDLLRLPGTLNWKTPAPKQVVIKSAGRGAKPASYYVRQLTSMNNKDWESYKQAASESLAPTEDVPDEHPAPKRSQLSLEVRKAFDYQPQPGKRNNAIFQLIACCKESGMSRADTHALVRKYPPAVSKWGAAWRISNDVDRIWQKCQGPEDNPLKIIDEADDGTEQPSLIFHPFATLRERVRNAPAPRYLFENILVEGDYGVISAEDKAGKSFIMLDAAVSAASGRPWMDKFKTVTPGPVVVCLGEGSERKQVRRIDAICEHKGLSADEIARLPLHILLGVPQIRDEDHLAELERTLREVKPSLVLIDPFYLAAQGVDFARLADVGAALQPIQHICQRYNAALLLSHHWNKTGNGDPHSRTSGVGLTAWGRVLIAVQIVKEARDPETKKTTVLQKWHIKGDEVMTEDFDVERTIWADDPTDLTSILHYQLRLPEGVEVARAKGVSYRRTAEQVLSILKENLDGLGFREIARELRDMNGRDPSRNTLTTTLTELENCGNIVTQGNGGRGNKKVHLFLEDLPPKDDKAQPRELDMAKATSGPRRRSRASAH